MPNCCCVPGCRSGYKGTTKKVSLFSLPLDKELREKWKRAIPRQESGGFNFDSKYTRVCAHHFHASDIVTAYDISINGVVVSLEREKPTLKADAVPRIFKGLPSCRTRKPRTRSPRERPREPSPCSDRTGAVSANDDLALTSDTVEINRTDAACQTDLVVDSAGCDEVRRLQCKLRATKQLLRQCQRKLAEYRKQRLR
ncbi:uncharacterized protein LOC119402248 [Rhipicephalus sanguineus]|uniref:THAP-type domain-containing protein n=1 Tax=Rhipicephalus sanguineus TaxID=34632 RepID=A0A9D4PG59_RHISA|nr:uncharacterized protein LOC119402248 [Rhipicephalus sanguineus]KAH7939898.1 hypothetical protein HPB52_018880 [Rhipicephalus sanguineus]